jgi:hypothetical protein
MEPAQAPDQLGGELHALRVYFETPLIDLAQPGNNVQVAAWSLGEKDVSIIVFKFIETAEAAPVAERFPSLFIIIAVIHWLQTSISFSGLLIFPGYIPDGDFKAPVVNGKPYPVRQYFLDPCPFDNAPLRDRPAVNNRQTVGVIFLPADPRDFQDGEAGDSGRPGRGGGFYLRCRYGLQRAGNGIGSGRLLCGSGR